MRKAIIVGMVGVVGLVGCKMQFIPVETVRTEIQHHTDTVKHTDSVRTEKETVIREARAGDSLLLARLGIQLKENERAILVLRRELEQERSRQTEVSKDAEIKVDSIPVPYPVAGKVSRWEQAKLVSVGIVGGVGLVGLVGAVLWIRRRYKKWKLP